MGVRAARSDDGTIKWPLVLGLWNSIVVALAYLRRNRVQAAIGEQFGVSRPTVSRAVTALTPVLGRMLVEYVPVAEEWDPSTQYIVDGTLLPCWSWHDQRPLWSGEHKTTVMNVQVVGAAGAAAATLPGNGT